MANSNSSNSDNIYVKVDHNNLICIDPNSTLSPDGSVIQRRVQPENLVMYVNLEADIVPRTILSSSNDQNNLTSIAKGTLNFLRNQNGKNYDTSWTDSYFTSTENSNQKGTFFQEDSTGQSFGIDSINIIVKGTNFIPQVVITFIDVRGKTLFNSAENSPYNAFFHLPWPIFYLTIKGFYGKAIKYRLHLVKFNTRFNDTSGNFEVTTNFVGSTYAYLNDIPLKGALNSPYMFPTENTNPVTWNPKTQQYTQKVTKSARGYSLLQSVYAEYKQKGLIPKEFPVKTLRELGILAQSLDKILEREIFGEAANMKIFAGFKGLDDTITSLRKQIISWGSSNLKKVIVNPTNNPRKLDWYNLSGDAKAMSSSEKILGATSNGTLERIIIDGNRNISDNRDLINKLKDDTDKKFSVVNVKTIGLVSNYYQISGSTYFIAFDKLVSDIDEISKTFDEQKQKFQQFIEEKINNVIKDPTKGIGFEPTVRNIFAVILANADVFVRLMKNVHQQAFDIGVSRAKELDLKSYSKELSGIDLPIYPWPQIRKKTSNGKENVTAYPGEKDLQEKLKSKNKALWPEIDFMENYIGISTNKYDPLAEKEGGVNNINFIYESNANKDVIKTISTLSKVEDVIPYVENPQSSLLYEIWERAYYFTLVDSFNTNTIKELAQLEFKNIEASIGDNNDLKKLLRDIITNPTELVKNLQIYSQFDRFPYYEDHLPTVPYISDSLTAPFKIEQYVPSTIGVSDDSLYPNLNDNLLNYTPEDYRKNIYPFNSSLYLSYLNQKSFTDDNFKFKGLLELDTQNGFICSKTQTIEDWVKPGHYDLFSNGGLTIGSTTTNILNTPYFHKQLFSDFNNTSGYGKYIGSSYLLLNSLPFYDLDDSVSFGGSPSILMSSLFREVGSTHYIPYYLMLKWGSLYHRYKKYITDGVDILDGFLTTGNTTTSVDGNLFFDNNNTDIITNTFLINGVTVSYSNSKDVGIHPFYDAIFHQVVNGYNHYIVESGSTSFETNLLSGSIHENVVYGLNGLRYWTGFVDNSKFDSTDLRYTLLPSCGNNTKNPITGNTFQNSQDSYLRTVWDDNIIPQNFSGLTFSSSMEYNKSLLNEYSLNNAYKKVIDLIGTFSPDILSSFEDMFIQFSNETAKEKHPYVQFSNVTYHHFQDLLKDIVSISKSDIKSTIDDAIIKDIKNVQLTNLKKISNNILTVDNLIKFTIGNPKEIDAHVFNGFAQLDSVNTFTYNPYNDIQLTDENKNYIKLYIGEDIDLYYQHFFQDNNVELSESNILQFRPLILIYAGYLKSGHRGDVLLFQEYIRTNIIVRNSSSPSNTGGSSDRASLFLTTLINNFKTLTVTSDAPIGEIITEGYGDRNLKVELWNYFKSFNDKWIAGNSIGQRLLLEEFLFLDKANKDIGDKVFLNLTRLTSLFDDKNIEQNIYGAISMLLQGTGFDMRVLPAYVNFYGTNFNNTSKITPSKSVAKNIFGTFLEVDYQESMPKVVIQFVGPNSQHPDIQSKKYKFADDSFNLSNINNNPLVITLPDVFTTGDLAKSNKVVAFEVSFGDQDQGIFKGLQLDQSTIKNTTESFNVLENIARSESGAGTYNVDISLFEYYRQASYSCEVTCMGNVMIQPTMFFYLKNVPMFKGSYWITEVSHKISNNNITTTFKGSRIPYASLPDPNDSFLSSYKTLFDKLTNTATARVPLLTAKNATTVVVEGAYVTDPGLKIKGEPEYTILTNDAGIDSFGIPYNGINDNGVYIQKIRVNSDKSVWYRTKVSIMGVSDQYDDNTSFTLLNHLKPTTMTISKQLKWGELKEINNKSEFYASNFQLSSTILADKIITGKTSFKNPLTNSQHLVSPSYKLDGSSNPRTVSGPIDIGPNKVGYGISVSRKLASTLGLVDGSVVYFTIN